VDPKACVRCKGELLPEKRVLAYKEACALLEGELLEPWRVMILKGNCLASSVCISVKGTVKYEACDSSEGKLLIYKRV